MTKKSTCGFTQFYSSALAVTFAGLMLLVSACKKQEPDKLRADLTAAVEAGDMRSAEKQIDLIDKNVENPEQVIAVIESGVNILLHGKKFDQAGELAKYIREKASADKYHYRNLASSIDIQCVIGEQRWDDVKPVFAECVAVLPDSQLARLMRFVFNSLARADRKELIGELTESALTQAKGKQRSINYAATKWIDSRVDREKNALPKALRMLNSTSVSPDTVGSIFLNHFYDLASDKDAVRELCAIGSELILKIKNESIVNDLKVKILDGAFIVEDFDLAVSMLEQGIPGKDEAWHAMSLPKVKAHRAQADGKLREAVKYYREFMNVWKNSDKVEEIDPQSHIVYSKEWILARNAKRIAAILDSIPDKAAAEKARNEAAEYFKTAIEKVQDNQVALEMVNKEADELK